MTGIIHEGMRVVVRSNNMEATVDWIGRTLIIAKYDKPHPVYGDALATTITGFTTVSGEPLIKPLILN